jgi:hypothetical protein
MAVVRRTLGAILIALSVLALIQSARELLVWERGRHAYAEESLVELPIAFAGHHFTVRDDQSRQSGNTEHGREGTAEWLRDGVSMDRALRAIVRPARHDLGRYHLWLDAWKFVDRATGDTALWLTRRVQPSASHRATFEVTVIDSRGASSVNRYSAWQLGRTYPVLRSTQFLHDDDSEGMPFSMLGAVVFPPILIVFPLGSLVAGVLLVRRRRDASVAA